MDGRLRLDAYVRVSRVGGREGPGFMSPEIQRDKIAAWASLRDVDIIAWHEDLDQSGGKLSRPGLDEMLARVHSGETGGVAVAHIDRLSRAGVVDALRLVEDIHAAGGQLAVVDLGIDPTTPVGELVMTVFLALGRMQRRQIKAGWAEATERAVRRGVHAQVPFGYRKSRGRGTSLEPDDNAQVVSELFARRAAGASWEVLARWMDTQSEPRHAALWNRRSVETIVRNRAYLGEARYGEHVQADAHPALVPVALWDAANEARGVRPARGTPGLLSGLVRCAGCRYRMAPSTTGERRQRIYRCKGKHGAGVCPQPAFVMRDLVDSYVEREFLEHYSLEARGFTEDTSLVEARETLEAAEAELVAYRDNTVVREVLESLGGSSYEDGLIARVNVVVQAREALDEARSASIGLNLTPALRQWPDFDHEDRRRLMHAGIDCVFLRRPTVLGRSRAGLDSSRVKILWRGEAPHDLPGPGLRPEFRGFTW